MGTMSSRLACLSFILCLAFFPTVRAQQQPPAVSPDSDSTARVDPYSTAIAQAMVKMDADDKEGALAELNKAIAANPKMSGAYVFRASLYCQKKMWPQADADFKTAIQIDPGNVVLKFNLIEVKFLQKQYDAARPEFAALVKDPDMGDFAAYKVFLCDLFAGHMDLAAKELAVFNDKDGNPSYYFGNAAWSLMHKNPEDARTWLVSASNIYPLAKNKLYAASLWDVGLLPLPNPPKTP